MFIVEELVGGKWYTVRSFTSESDAITFAAWIGKRARVRKA
jgi:hypothetical protein